MKISGALKKLIKKIEYFDNNGLNVLLGALKQQHPVNYSQAMQIYGTRKDKKAGGV